jgi:cobalt/nickel transport system permease protein
MNQATSQRSPDTFWSRLDPRTKTLCIISLAIALSITPIRYYFKFILYIVLIFSLMFISRVQFRAFLTRVLFIIPMIVFLGLSIIIFSSSPHGGPHPALIIANTSIKMILVFLTVGILILTVPFSHIIKGLEAVRIPRMVLVMLNIMYRYIYLILEEAGRVIRSIKSRSCGNRKLWKEWKIINSIISVFLVRLVEKSRRVYIAMLSRGDIMNIYSPGTLKFKPADYLFGIAFHCVLAGIFIIQRN